MITSKHIQFKRNLHEDSLIHRYLRKTLYCGAFWKI